MAKNKNQNRQREQRDERANQPADTTDHVRGPMAEEHGMPAVTQVARKQHKKFGHN